MLALAWLDVVSRATLSMSEDASPTMIYLCVIFAPSLGLFDTLRKMIVTKSGACYNRQTGSIQIVTNFLRFVYWRHRPVKSFLVRQSLSVFGLHVLLSVLSFVFDSHSDTKVLLQRSSWDVSNMSEFVTRVVVMFVSIVTVFGVVCVLVDVSFALTATIVLANGLDVMTSLPHFIEIVWWREVAHVSYVVVFQYLVGDIMKLILFIIGRSGWPFIASAIVQTLMDSILVTSFIYQKRSQRKDDSERQPLLPQRPQVVQVQT